MREATEPTANQQQNVLDVGFSIEGCQEVRVLKTNKVREPKLGLVSIPIIIWKAEKGARTEAERSKDKPEAYT